MPNRLLREKFKNIDKCNFVYFSDKEKLKSTKKIDFFLNTQIKKMVENF